MKVKFRCAYYVHPQLDEQFHAQVTVYIPSVGENNEYINPCFVSSEDYIDISELVPDFGTPSTIKGYREMTVEYSSTAKEELDNLVNLFVSNTIELLLNIKQRNLKISSKSWERDFDI